MQTTLRPLHFWVAAMALWGLIGCVDLTEPWKRRATMVNEADATAGGQSGIDDWRDGGDVASASGWLDTASTSEDDDASPLVGIDSFVGPDGPEPDQGRWDAGSTAGTGGVAGPGGSGGAAGASDGGADVSLVDASDVRGSGGGGGSGGSSKSGGSKGSGGVHGSGGATRSGGAPGAGGASRAGGAPGSGGIRATGGATTPDAAPDRVPDLAESGVEAAALLSALVAYYPCEAAEANGLRLPDLSGEGHDGTLASTATSDGSPGTGSKFTAGRVGNALVLSASGRGYVSLPPSVFAGATDLTIAAWIKLATSAQWQKVLDVGVNAKLAAPKSNGMVYMYLAPKTNTADGLAFGIATDGFTGEQRIASDSSPGPSDGWTHVAVVLGASSVILYVDGQQAVEEPHVTLRPDDLGDIDYAWLGRSQFTDDPTFDGAIDEVRVYRRALAPAEVKALYQDPGP